MKLPKIIDNNRKIFLDVIKEIASMYEDLSIATGYWDLEGTKILINNKKLRSKNRICF